MFVRFVSLFLMLCVIPVCILCDGLLAGFGSRDGYEEDDDSENEDKEITVNNCENSLMQG